MRKSSRMVRLIIALLVVLGQTYATAVDCSSQSLTTEGECNACSAMHDVYWDGDACVDIDCAADATLSTNQEQCKVCDGHYWTSSQCTDGLCQGQLATENTCIQCSQYYWDSTHSTCNAIDCTSSVIHTNQSACESCDGRIWNGTSCDLAVDCSTVNLDTESKCRACSKSRAVYWDGSACQSADCDAPGGSAECFPCAGKYWDSSSCQAIDDIVCDGILDSAVKCLSCQHFWNNTEGTCQATTCGSGAASKEECEACEGQYWDEAQAVESKCQTFDCMNTAQNAMECAACQHLRKLWDSNFNQCIDLDCTLTQSGRDSCMACNKFWLEGYCRECPLDCPSCDENGCVSCNPGMFLNSTSRLCLDCTLNEPTTEDTCLSCPGKYWDDSCKELLPV